MITLKYFPTVVLEFVYLSDNNVYRTHIHESLKVQYLLRYTMHYTIKVNMFYTAPLYHRTASIIPTVHYFFFSTHLTWQLLKQELDWAGLDWKWSKLLYVFIWFLNSFVKYYHHNNIYISRWTDELAIMEQSL